MAGKRRRKRKKNLSTGAWVAIGVTLGVVVPALIVGGVMIYGIKKGTKMVDDAQKRFDERTDDFPMEPDYGVPDTWS